MNESGFDGLRPFARRYTREYEVIADIKRLMALTPAEFARALEIVDYRLPDCPRLESLVYLVRDCVGNDKEDEAWRIIDVMTRRLSNTILATFKKLGIQGKSILEECCEDLITVLYEEWLSCEESHEFWEVRFGLCLQRKIVDIAKKQWRIRQNEVQLTYTDPDREDDNPFDNLPDETQTNPEQSIFIYQALAVLPENERNAFVWRFSEGWSEAIIADRLKVTKRTVRNYLARAQTRLQTWRESGSE